MPSTTINLNGKDHTITYEVKKTEKGRLISVTNLPDDLKLGKDLTFGLTQNDSVLEIPAFSDDEAQRNKGLVVRAIFKAENIDWNK